MGGRGRRGKEREGEISVQHLKREPPSTVLRHWQFGFFTFFASLSMT
jgi:hypothetical protein